MNQEKKRDISFIIIFVIILFLTLGYLLQSTYSKYRKRVEVDTDFSIAKWNLRINDEDIRNKSVLEKDIIPILDASDYVNENVIAPGTTGYCDITIMSKQVDVTFNYELTPSIPEESTIKDLIITAYTINPDQNTTKVDYVQDTKITGTIPHNTNTTTIRLYLKWDDSPTNIMDNTADTNAAADPESKAIIKTTLTFNQVNQ